MAAYSASSSLPDALAKVPSQCDLPTFVTVYREPQSTLWRVAEDQLDRGEGNEGGQGGHRGASRASRGREEFPGPLHRPHVLRSAGASRR
jgi:hypothetical protein